MNVQNQVKKKEFVYLISLFDLILDEWDIAQMRSHIQYRNHYFEKPNTQLMKKER